MILPNHKSSLSPLCCASSAREPQQKNDVICWKKFYRQSWNESCRELKDHVTSYGKAHSFRAKNRNIYDLGSPCWLSCPHLSFLVRALSSLINAIFSNNRPMFWPKLKLSKPHWIPHEKDDGLQKRQFGCEAATCVSQKINKWKTKSEHKDLTGQWHNKHHIVSLTVKPLTNYGRSQFLASSFKDADQPESRI